MERERISKAEIEVVYRFFDKLFDAVDYHEHKRTKTSRMVRRLLGRAHPTEREAATLTGVFCRATEAVRDSDHLRDGEN